MLQQCRRLGSTTALYKGSVFPKLLSSAEISELVHKSTWSVQDVIPKNTEAEVDPKVVKKMLKMSGFDTNISAEEERKWTRALQTQIGFINHLYESNEITDKKTENSAEMFRLIASDHNPPEPLTLDALLQEVENLRASNEKGENGFDRTHLRNDVTLQKKGYSSASTQYLL